MFEQEQVVTVVALLVLLLVALKEDVRANDLRKLLVDLEDCGLKKRQLLELLAGVMLLVILRPAPAVGGALRSDGLLQHVLCVRMIFLDVGVECRVREI